MHAGGRRSTRSNEGGVGSWGEARADCQPEPAITSARRAVGRPGLGRALRPRARASGPPGEDGASAANAALAAHPIDPFAGADDRAVAGRYAAAAPAVCLGRQRGAQPCAHRVSRWRDVSSARVGTRAPWRTKATPFATRPFRRPSSAVRTPRPRCGYAPASRRSAPQTGGTPSPASSGVAVRREEEGTPARGSWRRRTGWPERGWGGTRSRRGSRPTL